MKHLIDAAARLRTRKAKGEARRRKPARWPADAPDMFAQWHVRLPVAVDSRR